MSSLSVFDLFDHNKSFFLLSHLEDMTNVQHLCLLDKTEDLIPSEDFRKGCTQFVMVFYRARSSQGHANVIHINVRWDLCQAKLVQNLRFLGKRTTKVWYH